jgi:L-malate glycosyltransferase
VVLESLACGTPALVSDLGGPSEIVHHNETGLILPAGDQRQWTEALTAVLTDPSRRERMGRNARAYAEECTFARSREDAWAFYARNIEAFRANLRTELR